MAPLLCLVIDRCRSDQVSTNIFGRRIRAFRRASSTPSEVITIYYDSRQNLIAQGIIPRHSKLPQPFPNGGFVPDPS